MVVPHLADRVGQVLGGRYRLLAPLGSGASATVYLGDDITLRRRVAVKVLHPALADDEAFLRRFRAEAQVAASLSHPNVLAVHDWGQDGDTPFLVGEFLGGGNLRAMLDANGPLDHSQVLVVGLQSARGLAYAHRRQLVHRDIKPANLLFDDEARLRIADFGLARALAEAAWTEPAGAVLGTARYASPEQARGEALTARSDVYSLALVLVEAATGQVPFAADTTIGTLMARVATPLPVPDTLGPLGPVLAAAGAPDPADRPDAAQFVDALLGAARQLPRPAPLPLAAVAALSGGDDTEIGLPPSTRPAPDATAPTGEAPGTATAPGTEVVPAVTAPGDPAMAAPVMSHSTDDAATAGAGATAVRTRRRRWPLVVALAVIAVAAGAGAWWYTTIRVVTNEVPVLVGVPLTEAQETAERFSWELGVTEQYHPTIPAGSVIAQDPDPGVELAEGDALAVVVSLGPAPVPVPDDVIGKPLAEAEEILAGVGLSVGVVTERFDEDVAGGVVLAWAEELPAEVPFGSALDLVISAGPEPRTLPGNLLDLALDEVRSLLESLGLPVRVDETFSDDIPAGGVVSASPAPGSTVERGTPVDVRVSLGPPVVAVPNVNGLSVVAAAERLEAAGLVVAATRGSPTRTVAGTDPASGTSVRVGSAVTIITG